MLKVIGLKNCSKCEITKGILDKKKVDYEYTLISEFPKEEQDKLIDGAFAVGLGQFPLILKDSNYISLQEV